ncbi:hypothetical protein [uncultured Desulfuromonas sp.]|uniref:hypothetical protein n=1 Tax=uncultured Desulfuromonas sp. TaxID=181013 RepID=UPI002AABDAE9|nr:hypothetical protein [uncultured Desulfuromonas sp.]
MARHATINFTSEVLALIDLHAQKTKSNRSAVVRDACLSYLDQEGDKSFALIKLEQRNAETLRRLASLFSKDHDKFLNTKSNPPALPGDPNSLTVPGLCSTPSPGFVFLTFVIALKPL